MTIQDAKEYISYCIKDGFAEAGEFKGMTNKELIEWAEYNAGRAENALDQQKEQEMEAKINEQNK